MIVICLEGCHGCGKSTLTNLFNELGYKTLDEAFLDMPHVPAMSPQTMLMESVWIGNWFIRLLNLADKQGEEGVSGEEIFIADRSPFSAVCYAGSRGPLLEPVIRAQMEEVLSASNIEIYSVHLSVSSDVLWSRITSRLEKEPSRAQYSEDKMSHMIKINEFYNSFEWDLTVDNSGEDGRKVVDEVIKKVDELRSKKVSSNVEVLEKEVNVEVNIEVVKTPNKSLSNKFEECCIVGGSERGKVEPVEGEEDMLYAGKSPTTVVTKWLEV
ncbi:hypothetical protein TrST_g11913 [Triparma strigata]|uniref:NadR/Ttd14 AAA domain-containing protein n=1 Tax=Triparma strigata TaxID=1606541 RepID=A0A9W6ZPI1_9STRA|nr:hypothetical protein TrST_g11913 [Triparma strigata]